MDDLADIQRHALAAEKAPDSLVSRYGLLTLYGVENMPAGMWHAVKDDVHHPWQTLGMVAGSAAVGAIVKTVLPNTGNYGKIAGLAIGGYLAYRASEPALDAFRIAGAAKTMNDIDVAGHLLGDVGGSFVVNSALSGAAYKLGGMGAQRYFGKPGGFPLPNETPLPDNPAPGGSTPESPLPKLPTPEPPTPKVPVPETPVPETPEPRGGFFSTAVMPNLPGAIGITGSSSANMFANPRLAGIQRFDASDQKAPDGTYEGRIDGNTLLSVTVQLKSKASDQEMDKVLSEIALGKRPAMTDAEFAEKFGASKESLDDLSKFAQAYDLKVSDADLRSGRVVLTGTARDLSEAFRTEIGKYDVKSGQEIHGRQGALFMPKTVSKDIEGVFGLDNRPQAVPHNRDFQPRTNQQSSNLPDTSYRADEVAAAYNFPKDTTGKGQNAALLELGGGIDLKNEAEYYKENGLKMPTINVLALNGAKNETGRNLRADKEVAMDSQILGTVAPDAKQTIIFVPNSEQGFVDAVGRASFPKANETNQQAISISWGQPTDDWSDQGKRGMDLALKKAAIKGITVVAATGDDGANDGVNDGNNHVDYPAANPFVTAVGGTSLRIKDGKIQSEVAWNDRFGSSGGGFSADGVPEYQNALKQQLGMSAFTGRALPDISGNASPATGYKIHVAGRDIVSGGTSAVAPLYTALALRINEGLGGTKTVGFINPMLYKQASSGKAQYLRDVTHGSNNGFNAGKGWDPVTGWGSLDGEKLLQAYKQLFS